MSSREERKGGVRGERGPEGAAGAREEPSDEVPGPDGSSSPGSASVSGSDSVDDGCCSCGDGSGSTDWDAAIICVPYGYHLRPKQPERFSVPEGFLLTLNLASLGSGNDSISRHVVELWYDGGQKKLVLARLIPGRVEQVSLSVQLTCHAGPCSFVLVEGNGVVDILGTVRQLDDISENSEAWDRVLSDLSSEESTGSEEREGPAGRAALAARGRESDSDSEGYEDESDSEPADAPAPAAERAKPSKPAKAAEAPAKSPVKAAKGREAHEQAALQKEKPAAAKPAGAAEAAKAGAPGASGVPDGFRNVKGVYVKDVAVGRGPVVKQGKTVSIRYVLRLNDPQGPVFDATRSKSFQFTVGAGSVVSGMNIGLAGMQVGGKRVMIVPPHLGYGRAGHGGVPGNATLYFEVELVDMKK